MRYLLDTCTVIWLSAEPEKISTEVLIELTKVNAEIAVSAVCAAEIACACERERLQLDRHWKIWFRYVIKENQWEVLPVTLAIIEEAWSLPEVFHSDPADRIIVATARLMKMSIVTGDRKLLDYPHVNTLF